MYRVSVPMMNLYVPRAGREVPAEALEHGLILDAHAAKLLAGRGIDVGGTWSEDTYTASHEHFVDQDEYIDVPVTAKRCTPAAGAQVISRFYPDCDCIGEGEPAAYLYENGQGQRFLVYTFDIDYLQEERLYRSYARSRQLAQAAEWLGGRRLPAYLGGNPDVYIMAKKDGHSMAVGVWNCYGDEVLSPEIELDGEYTTVRGVNCTARVEGKCVLPSDIAPYAFAGFEVCCEE